MAKETKKIIIKEQEEIPRWVINVGRKRTSPHGQSFYERFITIQGVTKEGVEEIFDKIDNKINKEEEEETQKKLK